MQKAFAGIFALPLFVFCGGAMAAAKSERITPEDEIQYRQSVMVVLGRARMQLTAMVKGETPYDAANATRIARFMVELATRTLAGYGPGTEKGAPTKADLKIWREMSKYKSANDDMQAAVAKLPAAAGSLDTLKEKLTAAGKLCKSCHDTYKLDEYRN